MVSFIVSLIILLLIVGFIYWIWTLLRPHLSFIPQPFLGIIDTLILVLLVAVVLFYAIIPLIRMIPGSIKF